MVLPGDGAAGWWWHAGNEPGVRAEDSSAWIEAGPQKQQGGGYTAKEQAIMMEKNTDTEALLLEDPPGQWGLDSKQSLLDETIEEENKQKW